ncbi:MAG TPA: ATP-binding protein [Cyclobacteriaceae bacterium]|nr:ATP-binding protein [Cyclobacteriaceae bacterium]
MPSVYEMKTLENYIRKGRFYEAVVEDGSDIIFIVDFNGNILYHNSAVRVSLGYRSRSLIGRNFFDYIHPDALAVVRSEFKRSQKRAYTQQVEFQFLCKDKNYRFLEFNAINLKFKENVPGFILDCRDITERKRDAEELVRLGKAKEQFLANISHEIRTPINGIAGMATLLSQSQKPDEQETYLSAIRNSAENLKVIINDLLDLSAITSGKLKFEKIPFNLVDLLPTLLNTFAYAAREKNLELTYTVDKELNRLLLGDPVRLNQILINLISNAMKFTHSGSIHIACSYERTQKLTTWVKIEVADTGVGIPKEKLDTIFESFSQADASVTRKYGGTGLGLTIARQLVELQNGKITVKSEENIGSTFTVLIPYGKPKYSTKEQSTSEESKVAALGSHSLDVLLVEDNDINRLYAKSVLKNWNCRTETAENGLVAIEKLKAASFDVILMDVQMPVMDGFETTKAIRMMPQPLRSIPIVALTANATRSDVERCLAAGMNDYLPKPFAPDDLYRKLFEELKIVPSVHAKPINPPSGDTFYNLDYLKHISGNNQEFIQEMIQTFVASMPQTTEGMTEAVSKKDWDRLSKLAHQVKPSFTLMGLDRLRDKVALIEEYSKTRRDLHALPQKVAEFMRNCESAVDELRQVKTI